MISFKSVKNPIRMSDVIARQIEDKIISGQLKTDSALPPEAELLKQFGVSRGTLREALRTLEAKGMVKVRQGSRGGTIVTELTDEFISEILHKAIRLGRISVKDMSHFRLALEPSIAEMVALVDIDANLLSQMEKNILKAKVLCERNEDAVSTNTEFHLLLATASGNPLFVIILSTLMSSLISTEHASKIRRKIEGCTIDYHRNILEAIRSRDPVRARAEMYQHIIQIHKLLIGNTNLQEMRPNFRASLVKHKRVSRSVR